MYSYRHLLCMYCTTSTCLTHGPRVQTHCMDLERRDAHVSSSIRLYHNTSLELEGDRAAHCRLNLSKIAIDAYRTTCYTVSTSSHPHILPYPPFASRSFALYISTNQMASRPEAKSRRADVKPRKAGIFNLRTTPQHLLFR